MTLYRVYVETNGPRYWVEYVEAESEWHAKSQVEDDPNNWGYLAAVPLPKEMYSECLCSKTPVLFIGAGSVRATQIWTCQNCQNEYICPPDEIDWEQERQADDDPDGIPYFGRGYESEPRPSNPYYEDDVTLELED